MKIFISHSWKNKSAAQLIAESLQDSAEVWQDIQHLKPGDVIQPEIDKAMEQMDAILLLWSNNAAESQGVDAEIRTATKLKKKILPVLLDDTPTSRHPLLAGLYGINFDMKDPKPGIFRIQAGLLRLSLGAMDLESAAALNDLTAFEGFYQYVQEYRNRKGIAGEDSTDWAIRSMEQCNNAYQSLSDLRDKVGLSLKFMQDVFARVQSAGDNRSELQSILNEVIRHPESRTKDFQVLISFIEGKISSLPAESEPPVQLASDAQTVAANLASSIEQIEATPVRNLRGPQPAAGRSQETNPALQMVHKYIRSAPVTLQQFMNLAASLPSTSLKQVANALNAYLTNPNDLVPDTENGVLGFIDDAWLIHNTIYRCIEAGFFGAQDIEIQWDAVVQADPLVVQMMPPPVRGMLEQLLMQYLQVIAAEVAQYQPQFMPQAESNSYAPYMGYGEAVGGAPAQSEKTIDDVFYTIGDKMVYYGGS